ncbi:hypothetical protein [Asticcacaulis sp.]|uniref:hypothetical protein n=1 Tax=Asticcacaulis sp. TaxID=1872648 RepID=UPI0031D5AE3B
MKKVLGYALLCLAVLVTSPQRAKAAAGSHVVDDSGVETPGVCHVESWATRYDDRRGYLNLSPACTRKVWPRLEMGGTVQAIRDGRDDVLFGPAVKLNLRAPASGRPVPGLAVAVGGTWSGRSGQLEAASLNLPVTFNATDRLQINLNTGWAYTRQSAHPHALTYGAQIYASVTDTLGLMAETFGRDRGKPGAQVAARWTPGNGPYDLDVVVGNRVDGLSPRAISLGLTVRH